MATCRLSSRLVYTITLRRKSVWLGAFPSPGSGQRSQGWGHSLGRVVERPGQLDAPACAAAVGLGSAGPLAMPLPVSARWSPGGSWTLDRADGRTQGPRVRPFSHTQSGALDTGHTPDGKPWLANAGHSLGTKVTGPVPSPFLSSDTGRCIASGPPSWSHQGTLLRPTCGPWSCVAPTAGPGRCS